jgi:hypothetical protein
MKKRHAMDAGGKHYRRGQWIMARLINHFFSGHAQKTAHMPTVRKRKNLKTNSETIACFTVRASRVHLNREYRKTVGR